MQSIVETPSFLADAKEAGMDDAERMAIVLHLAANPLAEDVMAGTGGARKFRFKRPGTGKSGGYRIVSYYAGPDMPVSLLNVFTKGDKANLSKDERNAISKLLSKIAVIYNESAKQ